MIKSLLKLLLSKVTILSFIPLIVACQDKEEIKMKLDLKTIFESKPKVVEIGVNEDILNLSEQDFSINKKIDGYFKNLQYIALSILNNIEKSCFLNTDFINVTLYRNDKIEDQIKDVDALKKEDVALNKSIYVGFSTITQSNNSKIFKTATENDNFKNLLRLDFVEYDKGLLNMEKTIQEPKCESKSNNV